MGDIMLFGKYKNARNIRFSCAYLFRIIINGKYLLVKDEQGRNTFQPVGGVYKYDDDSFLKKTHAVQCMRFGSNSDLDCDLRVIVPREYAFRFMRYFNSEKGRETPKNLYREFKEEILDRIPFIDRNAFESLEYRFCGRSIEPSRMNENDMQLHIADIVELIPTPAQAKEFQKLTEHSDSVYYFATKDEIYNLGRTNGNQIQTISNHSYKILTEEEGNLKPTSKKGKFYKCSDTEKQDDDPKDSWTVIEKADTTKPFTFISYNSLHGKYVWDFCNRNTPPLQNLWIDRKSVSENWLVNVENALNGEECKKAILFINKEYLTRSTACYYEASLIVSHNIPHIIVLVDMDQKLIKSIIKEWIYCDSADKERLKVFKKIFHYDDDTGHINCSLFSLEESSLECLLQAYDNLSR